TRSEAVSRSSAFAAPTPKFRSPALSPRRRPRRLVAAPSVSPHARIRFQRLPGAACCRACGTALAMPDAWRGRDAKDRAQRRRRRRAGLRAGGRAPGALGRRARARSSKRARRTDGGPPRSRGRLVRRPSRCRLAESPRRPRRYPRQLLELRDRAAEAPDMITGSRELVAKARGGDAAALGRLTEEYSGRVFRLAYGITRNHADAEEVVQD